MRTLDHWRPLLLRESLTIDCKKMQLITGPDFEPPTFIGSGYIEVVNSTQIRYTLMGESPDGALAANQLNSARNNPYDTSVQFRLQAWDYEGNELLGGWATPSIKGMPKELWPLTGTIRSLATNVDGPWVSKTPGVELVFMPMMTLPVEEYMESLIKIGNEEIMKKSGPGRQKLSVLDSEIEFSYSPDDEFLSLSASVSEQMPHPNLENWLSEPLRILLGQLIFPRLVARNFGDGSSVVELRPSPHRFDNAGRAALLSHPDLNAISDFWRLYARILNFVASDKDSNNRPNFETNSLTYFYEEIIQATHGSRWVQCLTFASAAEGIAKRLFSAETGCPPNSNKVKNLKIENYLKKLMKRDIIQTEHKQAWRDIRQAVMHGSLVSPWGGAQEDKQLMLIAELVHRLTLALLNEKSPEIPDQSGSHS